MKDLKELENDLTVLLTKYIDTKKAHLKQDDFTIEHDFFNILEDCENLINRINKEVEQ